MNLDQTIDIGTDIASFYLFHPDDLEHRKDDPLDWFAYGFSCRKEFEAGNLVAFRTGGDGGYRLRVTDGDMTDGERTGEVGAWEFGYTVRHGRVAVDNGDHLPSDQAVSSRKIPTDCWVAIPNGDYRVTVHPIDRTGSEDADSLPDYVIRFEPVNAPLRVAHSPTPPDLIPRKGRTPNAVDGLSADGFAPAGTNENTPLAETYPLLVSDLSVLPGGNTSAPISDELYEVVAGDDRAVLGEDGEGDVYVVAATGDDVPRVATLCLVNGASWLLGEGSRIKLRGKRLVRVVGRADSELLPRARVEPIPRDATPLEKDAVTALQKAFAEYAERYKKGKKAIPSSLFDRERVAAMTSGAALTAWLIERVPMPVETRFRLFGASDAERARELAELLAA